jgi:hypothetical protein
MPTMLDLYSGLGGASEAFVQAGWNVIRIENNPDLQYIPKTYDIDVIKLSQNKTILESWEKQFGKIDLIWASPPCTEFSNGFNSPKSRAIRAGEDYFPDMRHVHAALEIIRYFDPTYWVIENVYGASPYFQPLLGKPRQIVEPFLLWGNFPYLHLKDFKHKKIDKGSGHKLRSNYRALIPFELSFELFETIRCQKTLWEWV